MVRFQRLTRDDLNNLTREELLPRLDAEQQYWARKEKRGLSPADQQARKEFTDLLHAVINPAGLTDAMAETIAWLRGDRAVETSYWTRRPGDDHP
jgi:hypothetical protein